MDLIPEIEKLETLFVGWDKEKVPFEEIEDKVLNTVKCYAHGVIPEYKENYKKEIKAIEEKPEKTDCNYALLAAYKAGVIKEVVEVLNSISHKHEKYGGNPIPYKEVYGFFRFYTKKYDEGWTKKFEEQKRRLST